MLMVWLTAPDELPDDSQNQLPAMGESSWIYSPAEPSDGSSVII